MSDAAPKVPAVLSLEGLAQMIADEINRVEHAGKPNERRAHVKAHALAHLEAADRHKETLLCR